MHFTTHKELMATPAHRKYSETLLSRVRDTSLGVVAAAVAIVALVVVGVAYAVGHSSSHPNTTTAGPDNGGGGARVATTTAPVVPLSVVSISPATSATNVASNAPIQIQFSQPLKANATRPTLSPDVAGTWSVQGAMMTFAPQGGYLPYSAEQVTVPTTTAATEGKKVTTLAAPYQANFTVAAGSTLRVQQILAELNYMPLQFVGSSAAPATTAPTSTVPPAVGPGGAPATTATTAATTTAAQTVASTVAAEATAANAVTVTPENGALTWRFPNIPSSLSALWSEGKANTIDQGAIMAFESDHNMKMDGQAGPKVWAALVSALAARQIDARPYNYLIASEASPESLRVWSSGSFIYSSPANTGVAGAPTAKGTFPVFDRYASTTMSGSNPDGSTYHDPNIPYVAYFHGGDAVHGFTRGSYGSPQSVGCVELPIGNAKVVYGMDPYGTLVTVE
ncbi:MAG: Ig-like domain-containing protein [Actinomycetota bacterium]|nr:Ig-like domain-containing protein [Actinomycetota bacterium]